MEWLLFWHRLHVATGNVRYQHALEGAVYNALLGAQASDGMRWMYYTPLRYEKKWPSGDFRGCCYHSGPRGLARLPEFAYATDAEGIRVDLIEAGCATLFR